MEIRLGIRCLTSSGPQAIVDKIQGHCEGSRSPTWEPDRMRCAVPNTAAAVAAAEVVEIVETAGSVGPEPAEPAGLAEVAGRRPGLRMRQR